MSRALTLADIADHRAYEQIRPAMRDEVIALKRVRRIELGPIMSLTFENATTIRWQVQEMVRVEKILSDEGVQAELDVYNPLIPEAGHLAATLFLELTDELALREWLPQLIGIETAIELRIGTGIDIEVVPCVVDPDHARQLTRDEITASVHYLSFAFTSEQVARFSEGPVVLASTHHRYRQEALLSPEAQGSLWADLVG